MVGTAGGRGPHYIYLDSKLIVPVVVALLLLVYGAQPCARKDQNAPSPHITRFHYHFFQLRGFLLIYANGLFESLLQSL